MALKAIVATLILGTSSLALAESPRQARADHRITEERGELRAERRLDNRFENRRTEYRRFERERQVERERRLERERRFERLQHQRREHGRR